MPPNQSTAALLTDATAARQDTRQAAGIQDLWRGFMTARATLALVLALLQTTLFELGHSSQVFLLAICIVYFGAALAFRLFAGPRTMGHSFDVQWLGTIGVDMLVFSAMQFSQGNIINYTALFALPVLQASLLGSLRLSLGTAASATLVLLANAALLSYGTTNDKTTHFFQAALIGSGCFVIAFLAHHISLILVSEEQRNQSSQLATKVQSQVNVLVIESLTDGVLVVDVHGMVRAANPAAQQLLGGDALRQTGFKLHSNPAWHALVALLEKSFFEKKGQEAELSIPHPEQGPRRLQVNSRLASIQSNDSENLCVLFLKDQREMDARLRTEKLASMGRMSAAVAHEIRNPLSAISQATALLEEDLTLDDHKKMTQIVLQNAKRLDKIVDDILNISRLDRRQNMGVGQSLELNNWVAQTCQEWGKQNDHLPALNPDLIVSPLRIYFESEHLRRILLNLLDNAKRYASGQFDAIQVFTLLSPTQQPLLGVWSDGPPLEQSVKRHLFEPFFTSESRSSGLGLYICRELCERHGGSIAYQRSWRWARGSHTEGNEFCLTLRSATVDARSRPSLSD